MTERWSIKVLIVIGGILFFMVGLFVQKKDPRRGLAFLAAWALPGAGHVVMGKWKKGLFFFAILAAAYAFGMHIAGWRPVSFDDNPFYYVGQYGSGATLLFSSMRSADKAILRDTIHPSWFDPGLLYVCVVGLLNIVIMLNILDLKVPSAAAAPAAPAAPPAAAAPPPAPGKPA